MIELRLYVGISPDSTVGSEIWRNFQNPLFFSRSNVSRDNPAHAHKRDRWGEMASFCLLILEEKINCVNEFAWVI